MRLARHRFVSLIACVSAMVMAFGLLTSTTAGASSTTNSVDNTESTNTTPRKAKVVPGLKITVTPMPAGGVAQVVVTGPKQTKKAKKTYAKTLHGTKLLKGLAAGRYMITARPVAVSGGTDVPVTAVLKVKVKAKKQAAVTVSYKFVAAPGAQDTQGPANPGQGNPGSSNPQRTVSSAPRNVVAADGNTITTVSWAAPASDGNSPIDSYTATATDGSHIFHCDAIPPALSCPISGLTNGANYAVTVVAHNSAGSSAPSAAVSAKPATVPDAPTSLSAVAGDQSANLSWTAPQNNGGSQILSYTATAVPVVGGTLEAAHNCSSTTGDPVTAACIISGLVNGEQYSITVVARNRMGNSVASTATLVTPLAVPESPAGVQATSGDQSATVVWNAVTQDNGSPITKYVATAVDSDDNTFTCGATPSATTCPINNLHNGTTYTITVIARNSVGDSPPSAATTVKPATTPQPPTAVLAFGFNTSALVSWTAPPQTQNGGSPIDYYTATVTDGQNGSNCRATSPDLSCTINGLANGTTYSVTVTAHNSAGDSAPSTDVVTVKPSTAPDSPANVQVTAGNGSADVSWNAPSQDGGQEIASYIATAKVGDQTVSSCGAVTSGPLACTIGSLANGTQYSITVVAYNVNGGSSESDAKTVTPYTVPGPPTDVSVIGGDGQAVVSWSTPASNGGRPITSYTATAQPTNGVLTAKSCTVNTGDPVTTSCTIPDLTNTYDYSVTVIAHTNAGDSQASADPVMVTGLSCAQGGNCAVGDTGPGGGKVFYVASTPQPWGQYLEAATADLNYPGYAWAKSSTTCANTSVPGSSGSAIGTGRANTAHIISGCNNGADSPAAQAAASYTGGGKTDWYLPSQEEAVAMIGQASIVGGFANGMSSYYTSTQIDDLNVWLAMYSSQSGPGSVITGSTLKTNTWFVRPIRAFGLAPQAVTDVSVTPSAFVSADGNTATVTWTAPVNDGTFITSYTATATADGHESRSCTTTDHPTPNTCTIEDLSAGIDYSVTVTATNRYGTGAASTPVTASIPLG